MRIRDEGTLKNYSQSAKNNKKITLLSITQYITMNLNGIKIYKRQSNQHDVDCLGIFEISINEIQMLNLISIKNVL